MIRYILAKIIVLGLIIGSLVAAAPETWGSSSDMLCQQGRKSTAVADCHRLPGGEYVPDAS